MIVEAKWYEWWEKCVFFTPQNGSTKPKFVMVIPKPQNPKPQTLNHKP